MLDIREIAEIYYGNYRMVAMKQLLEGEWKLNTWNVHIFINLYKNLEVNDVLEFNSKKGEEFWKNVKYFQNIAKGSVLNGVGDKSKKVTKLKALGYTLNEAKALVYA